MFEFAIRLSFSGADQPLVERINSALRSGGFEILGSSIRGVDARAPKPVIERFFQTPVRSEMQAAFEGEPNYGRLPEGPAYRAYFPRAPELF